MLGKPAQVIRSGGGNWVAWVLCRTEKVARKALSRQQPYRWGLPKVRRRRSKGLRKEEVIQGPGGSCLDLETRTGVLDH